MVFIIAEAGVNHNGDVNLAKELVDVAARCGANAVKFQTFIPEAVISTSAPKAAYQKDTTGAGESQLDMVRKLALSWEDHRELLTYCTSKNIMFLSTPFDLQSIDFLNEMGLEIIKIPSGEITNKPYLQKISSLKKRIILSTGMAEIDEIQAALEVLIKGGVKRSEITLLHCNTAYPTPYEDANLKVILTLKEWFKVDVGYSDHTLGIECALAAAALGASVIEKHFTLDKSMSGPDHRASLSPQELEEMVRMIRHLEKAWGSGIKKPTPSELVNKSLIRKSIVAAEDIKEGEIFTQDNITTKRPAEGLSPMSWEEVLGKKANKDFNKDDLISL